MEDALTKSGVVISTDRGLTDEGEPWFVFFRQDDEEVIVHFARIGGEYVVASNFTEAVFRGRNFQTLVRELLDSHPYVLQHSSRSTVFLHPAALLAALVVTGYVKSSELNATADDGSRPEKAFRVVSQSSRSRGNIFRNRNRLSLGQPGDRQFG